MAGSSQIRTRRVRESTPGTTPAGNMTIHDFETWNMRAPLERETPGNVRADRQIVDNPATNISPSGSAQSDYIYGAYDGLFEEVSAAAYGAAVSVSGTDIAAVASGNKLTRASGWSTLAAGDVVLVTGEATNPAVFAALVSSVSGTDLVLAWPTLVNESAGPSVTVAYAGRLRQGTTLLTSTWEEFNTASSKGKQWKYCTTTGLVLNVPFPNKCRLNFTLVGAAAPIVLSAALANASAAENTNPARNSNVHFGDGADLTSAMGFRYAGSLLTMRIASLTLTLNNPAASYGGAGTFGPQVLFADDQFTGRLEMQVHRDAADVEDLIADCNDVNNVAAIGFGFTDADGLMDYWYLPACQGLGESTDGKKRQGDEMATLAWNLRRTSIGMWQHTKLG